MKYEPHFKAEIEEVIDSINKRIDKYAIEKDLLSTLTLCKCFLVSIFSLIHSSYAALVIRELNGCNVLMRSIIEYAVDLNYIALKNDQIINTKFSEYYKLLRYWRIPYIETYKDQIPWSAAEYSIYMQKNFPDVAKDKITLKGGDILKKDNSLHQFAYWNEVDRRIKSKYLKHWSGLSFPERVKIIKEYMKKDSFSGKQIEFFFKNYSDSSHSSTRSCIPHYDFVRQTFELNWNFNNKSLENKENEIFLVLCLALDGFAEALDAIEGKTIKAYYGQLFLKSPNFNKHLFSKYL